MNNRKKMLGDFEKLPQQKSKQPNKSNHRNNKIQFIFSYNQ